MAVRVRTTLGAVIVVGMALIAGAVTLVSVLRGNLTDGARATALSRAQEVAAVLESGERPGFAVAEQDGQFLQVLNVHGDVVAASANLRGRGAVVRLAPGRSAEISVPIDEDGFIAVATGADTPDGRLTVIAGRTLDVVYESTQIITVLLAIGLPLLLFIVAFTTWKVVGRALAPVEAIRREVDEISASELHRRVPSSPGRDEIARLSATMNRMLDRLERAHLRQRRFISDASHELRSPVASIREHAEVALAHPSRVSTAELAGNVLAEDLRVQRLVADLLLLARADEHSIQVHSQPVDLDDLVFDEARRLRSLDMLTVDTSAVSAGRVSGDAGGLRRVVRNIGENAARHARHRVAFALAASPDRVILTVDDDGPGIPVGQRERVFERFVRLDEARARDHGGSGLGLAIVAELVTAHGGTVAIGDGVLGGARVSVEFPPCTDPLYSA